MESDMKWIDKTLAAVGLQRKPEPPAPRGNAPRAHHEYFVEPMSEGVLWRARFYQPRDGGVEVREETGVESSEAAARKTAQAWCKQQGEA
jgi:hypothetical protein